LVLGDLTNQEATVSTPATIIAGRTFEERTSAKGRSAYFIDGERVRAERYYAAVNVSEGIQAWQTYAVQQGEAA
jgi:hypothetical protein